MGQRRLPLQLIIVGPLLSANVSTSLLVRHCRDSDRTSIRTSDVLRNVAELELIQAPNLSFIPPKSYNSLPQLKGGPLCLSGVWSVTPPTPVIRPMPLSTS